MPDRREERQATAIAVVTAGLNYKQSYDRLYSLVKDLDDNLTHQRDFEKYRLIVIQFFMEALEKPPTAFQDTVTLMQEHEWYRRHARENRRRAAKQRRYRQKLAQSADQIAASIPPKPIPPFIQSILPPTAAAPFDTPIPTTAEIDEAYEAFKRGEQGDPGAEHVKPKSPMFDRSTE